MNKLKSLLVSSKETTVEYPGMPGFELKLAFLGRESLLEMRKRATKQVYKKHQPTEEFDDDVFLELYTKAIIKGWNGLKFKYLKELVPINEEGLNLEEELEFNDETALDLIKNSTTFDKFVSDYVSDLGNFNKNN
jgi:hypothetical protein